MALKSEERRFRGDLASSTPPKWFEWCCMYSVTVLVLVLTALFIVAVVVSCTIR